MLFFGKSKILLFLLPAAVGIIILLKCQSRDLYPRIEEKISEHSTCKIFEYLSAELAAGKVVLVADHSPDDWRYKETVVEFLEEWSNAGDSVDPTLQTITLFLTIDSTEMNQVERYMDSWNFYEFSGNERLFSRTYSTAELEFYWRLGDIIHGLSVRKKEAKRVHLNLKSLCRLESDSSELRIAKTIVAELALHPEARQICFVQPKSFETIIKHCNVLSGGKTKYSSIARSTPDMWPGYGDILSVPPCDYVINDRETVTLLFKEAGMGYQTFDALIVADERSDPHLPVLSIPSLNTARMIVNRMSSLTTDESTLYSQEWHAMVVYMDAASGQFPQRADITDVKGRESIARRWHEWIDNSNPDFIEDVVSLQLWNRLIDSIATAPNLLARHYDEEILSILPGAPKFDGRFGLPTKAERAAQLKAYLSRNRDQIVVRTLIGISWVGDNDERARAMSALTRETGMKFNTASECSDWYRSNDRDTWE